MSGLGLCGGRSLGGDRPVAIPWMICSGLDGRLRQSACLQPRRLAGPRGNGLIRERLAVVGDPHRPIDPFFHLHLGRPDIVADLIELPVMGHGPIAAQDTRGFEAQAPV